MNKPQSLLSSGEGRRLNIELAKKLVQVFLYHSTRYNSDERQCDSGPLEEPPGPPEVGGSGADSAEGVGLSCRDGEESHGRADSGNRDTGTHTSHTLMDHSHPLSLDSNWMQWSHDAFEYLKNEVHSIGFGRKSLVSDVVVDG